MIELVDNNTVIAIGHERRRFKKWACGHAKRNGERKCLKCEAIRLDKLRMEEKKLLPFYLRP